MAPLERLPPLVTDQDMDDATDPDVFPVPRQDTPTVPRCVTCGRVVDNPPATAFERGAAHVLDTILQLLQEQGMSVADAAAIVARIRYVAGI